MIQPDLFTSFVIGGAASLLGLGVMASVQVEQARIQYALTLYRWGFFFTAALLLGGLAPLDRARLVFQAGFGFVAAGGVLIGWASRQMQGRRTPPWFGWALTALAALVLWLGAWMLPDSGYVLLLASVFTIISGLVFLDQAWVIVRGVNVSANEWFFLVLVGGYALNWVILLVHALTVPGPYAVHWVHGPSWWLPVTAVAYGLLPLCVATVVFSIINERLAVQLRTRALSDELTGALSRRGLRELGERMLVAPRRQYKQIAVLLLDVDHFKKINDTYGHLVGDDVLRHLVSVMQDRLRDDALLARYGGEEFVVLLPIRHPHEAQVVAERLRQSVETTPAQSTAGLIKMTISVGVAFHRPDDTLEQTLGVADLLLYEAKQTGRNKVTLAKPQTEPAPATSSAEVVST
ncbi:MAG: GGDEF domain-containing protein [Aquabacterium sp.]|nr:GGDEF domain-containing protein [Aquabacterium sp.]